jgi:hypothetical protein
MSSAKDKLRGLVNAWYGFGLFVGIANLVMNGIGIFSIVGAGIATVVSLAMTAIIGKLLLGRSSAARVVLVVLSAIGVVGGVLCAGGALINVFRGAPIWSACVMSIMMVASASINLRSFRVLTDPSVKAYF